MNKIKLDLSNALSPNLGNENGIGRDELSEFESRATKVLNRIKEESSQGKLPFMGLPCMNTEEIEETTDALLENEFEDFILLGIGGSSLGARALKEALVHPEWNLLSKGERKGYPRAFILENIDPYTFSAVLETVDIRKTVFNVVSKSG